MALAHQADCCLVVADGGGAIVSLLEVLSTIHERCTDPPPRDRAQVR